MVAPAACTKLVTVSGWSEGSFSDLEPLRFGLPVLFGPALVRFTLGGAGALFLFLFGTTQPMSAQANNATTAMVPSPTYT